MANKSASIIFLASLLSMTSLTVSCRQHRTPKIITFDRTTKANDNRSKEKTKNKKNIRQEILYIADSLFHICIPAPLSDYPEQIIKRKAYITSYNKENNIPNWVAWHLIAEHTDGIVKRNGGYQEDVSVPLPRATEEDYKGSGWSHGHMCPAADNKWDEEAMRESNLFTDICPQNRSLNSGLWNKIEQDCRRWAKKYGDVYIVCGPVLLNRTHETIGENKVVVPEAFFKVVLCLNGSPKAIGFIIKNNEGEKKRDQYINTVDDVERITGIDFFPALPDEIENEVEAHANIEDWK